MAAKTATDPVVFVGKTVVIEENVELGPFCAILDGPEPGRPTVIRAGAIIGANATVEGGCQVGRNAWLKPGSVASHDVPDNAIVDGNPGVVTGYRETRSFASSDTMVAVSALGPEIGARVSLNVGDSFIERLPHFSDMRGSLTPLQDGKGLPFAPARVFLVYGVATSRLRGEHAHRVCRQFLVAAHGGVSVLVDDSVRRSEVRLSDPTVGLYLPPMIWGVQYKFDPSSVLMVLASHPYDAGDYIRDYDEFRRLVSGA